MNIIKNQERSPSPDVVKSATAQLRAEIHGASAVAETNEGKCRRSSSSSSSESCGAHEGCNTKREASRASESSSSASISRRRRRRLAWMEEARDQRHRSHQGTQLQNKKMEERKARNRNAAKLARRRKKDQLNHLQIELVAVSAENRRLSFANHELENQLNVAQMEKHALMLALQEAEQKVTLLELALLSTSTSITHLDNIP